MPKYEVIRPWHGVSLGQVFETDRLHPALKSNVREVKTAVGRVEVDVAVIAKQEAEKALADAAHQIDSMLSDARATAETIVADARAQADQIRADAAAASGALTPSVAPTAGDYKPTKGDIAARLKELGIEFDGRKGVEELTDLLPDGDPLKPETK